MLQFRIFIISLLLISITSCSSNKLVGSWEFVDIYDGEIRYADSLKSKNNSSGYGTGILTFHKDGSFDSMGNSGNYKKEKKLLNMKYTDGTDTTKMKISYISQDYLFLFSVLKAPKTWVYKKVKSDKK